MFENTPSILATSRRNKKHELMAEIRGAMA